MIKISAPNQFAHALSGVAVLLGRVVWFPRDRAGTIMTVGALVLWAVLKEFLWDARIEKSQNNLGALVDFGFYSLGTWGCFAALALTGKL